MLKDTKSLGNNKAPACESRGFVHKKRGVHFDTPPYLGKIQEGIARLITPAQEKHRKIGYSSLECLSLDPEMRSYILPFLAELKEAAETLPRLENEDAGLMARGILVNLGEMDIKDLYGPEAYQKGLKLNYGRRPIVPLPY